MNIDIVASNKFHNAHTQYRADVEGFTLLRLTYGSIHGQSGGAIKTATVGDGRGTSAYPDRPALISAMKSAVVKFNGCDADVEIRPDGNGRLFGEISGQGSLDNCTRALAVLAEAMGLALGLDEAKAHRRILNGFRVEKHNDMREIYDAIRHTDGEPMYLSDGIYLEPDGGLMERR